MPTSLATFDFDGTAFLTNRDSPSGMNVPKAYEEAIEAGFGVDAFRHYRQSGGLKNGDPFDVVRDLWGQSFREGMLRKASLYSTEFGQIDWTRGAGFYGLVELLVQLKLRFLLSEIGTRFDDGTMWPHPVPGFLEYWAKLCVMPGVETAILSSGHDSFISKTFDVYGLRQPGFLVTNDLVRGMPVPCSKPDPRFFGLAMTIAKCQFGEIGESVYFGDDPKNDGQMAEAVGVPFFLVDPDGKHLGKPGRFTNWHEAPWPKW